MYFLSPAYFSNTYFWVLAINLPIFCSWGEYSLRQGNAGSLRCVIYALHHFWVFPAGQITSWARYGKPHKLKDKWVWGKWCSSSIYIALLIHITVKGSLPILTHIGPHQIGLPGEEAEDGFLPNKRKGSDCSSCAVLCFLSLFLGYW